MKNYLNNKLIAVGENIRTTRKERRVSLPELSVLSGVSKGALSKIEWGGNLTVKTLLKIARALNVESSSLLRF